MKTKGKIEKRVVLQAIGILCLGFLTTCSMAVTASLQLIGEMFPDLPYTTITFIETVPSFSGMIFCIIAGILAGKKISYKTLGILGMGGYILFGALPFFLTNFTAILICRLLLGVSLGLMLPVGNALIVTTLPAKLASTMVGFYAVIQSVGLFILQNAANFLVKKYVPSVWLCYLIGIIPFILMLVTVKNPPKQNAEEKAQEKDKIRLPKIVWPLGAIMMFFTMFYMCNSSGLSQIIIEEKIGLVDHVTLVFNINIFVCMLVGLVFGQIYNITKKFTIYIGLFMLIAGFLLMSFAESILMFAICSVILAIGYPLFASSYTMSFILSVPAPKIALGTSILASSASLGVSLASIWYSSVENIFKVESMRGVIFFSAGGLILILIALIFVQKPLSRAVENNAKINNEIKEKTN